MISATSSFLSFSFRFFFLQILRFTMRDWLALPLSPSSPSSIKNSSDEDDCNYDILNRSCTLQTSSEEDEEEEPLSSWVTLLAVFGVVRKTRSKSRTVRSISTASPQVLTEEEEEDALEEQQQEEEEAGELKEFEHIKETEETSVEAGSTSSVNVPAEAVVEEQQVESDDEYEQEISMKRSLSASSIASSSDSDNSTPACSQIMRPSKFFDEMTVDKTLRPVQVCIIIIIMFNSKLNYSSYLD